MVKKSMMLLIIMFYSTSVFATAEEKTADIDAVITITVTTTIDESEEEGRPIENARVIVINTLGNVIGTDLTNSNGEAEIAAAIPRDDRFPMKQMGEVAIITVADGYNEYIDFSVPINEFGDQKGKVHIPLQVIDPSRRNEPYFINGSFHRLTVFEMLDFLAVKLGLKRQNIDDPSISPAPWGPEITNEDFSD